MLKTTKNEFLFLRSKLCLAFILCSCLVYSQKHINTGLAKGINDIYNDSLTALIEDFHSVSYPFEFSEPLKERYIPNNLLNQLLDIEISEEGVGADIYYYGYVFFDSSCYFGIITAHHFSPGAFGINNDFIELVTLTYDGTILDSIIIGCFCNDTDMASNEYISTSVHAVVNYRNITITEQEIHGKMVESKDGGASEELVTSKYRFEIDSDGYIKKNEED